MISFIVPAYNEEKELSATLAAIHESGRAVGEEYEIIVADDASTDNTALIARENNARVEPVNQRNIGATRNAGAAAAVGDVYIFVDADTRVNPALVTSTLHAVAEGAVGGGARVSLDDPKPLAGRILTPLIVWMYLATGWAAGCYMFCRREAFERSGGFDETLFGAEEIYFSKALKKQGSFVILRESVVTSSRKLRMYSARELLGSLFGILLQGTRALKKRGKMSLWYDGRRE